ELAHFYAIARHVPDDRIIELDLPVTDDLSFDEFERIVLPGVRKFLNEHQLQERVSCLVTFYGVPLRIRNRANSPRDNRELAALEKRLDECEAQVNPALAELEKTAAELDPRFKPPEAASGAAAGANAESYSRRADHASRSLVMSIQRLSDDKQRQERLRQ